MLSSNDQSIEGSAQDPMQVHLECPSCHETNLIKYGKTPGTCWQRYRCLNPGCRRQFAAGSDHLIEPKIKAFIIEQLAVGTRPKKIVQDLRHEGRSQVSLRWIYALRRKMRQQMRDRCTVFADQRLDQKIKDIILNMLSAGVKPSQIKKIVGDDISLRYIYKLRQKKEYTHDQRNG
jgi:transposase-like protein